MHESSKESSGTTHASEKQLIDALRRSHLYLSYERVFGEATRLPLALRPVEFSRLAHRGKTHESPFCALLARKSAVCLRAHNEMVRHTHDRPHSITCPFGLTESAVPVRLGQRTIGFLRVGQVLRKSPAEIDRKSVTRALSQCGVAFDARLRRAWEHVPLVPPDRCRGIVWLLTFFAEQLSVRSNEILLQRMNAHPPVVLKARHYIETHKHEELSLREVAAAAGASVFHFCKMFHKSTGLKFTDYVARIRVQDARTQLLNPNRRISEVAYDTGFQSLTHFNRTFRRGESPSAFRARILDSATQLADEQALAGR